MSDDGSPEFPNVVVFCGGALSGKTLQSPAPIVDVRICLPLDIPTHTFGNSGDL